MNTSLFENLKIGNLQIALPLIQGGMGVRVSTSALAAAVSNEGALGVIAAIGLGENDESKTRDYLGWSRSAFTNSIKQTRRMTKNPFGVNIMCALTNYEDLVTAAQDENIDVIISGAGLPMRLPSFVKNLTTKLVPIVSSARAAHIICSTWLRKYNRLPDAVIVEGPMAGGHLGYSRAELADKENYSLDNILKRVIETVRGFVRNDVDIPVIAAGGIYDGKDIARVMKLGAGGVQMGTRFVCTHECDVAQEYKDAYIAANDEDVVIIQSPVGMPGRVIMNDFVKKISNGERMDFGCVYHCLHTCKPKEVNYCIAKALDNASRGMMDLGFAMAGSNVSRIKEIVSVKHLIDELTTDARASLATA